MKQLSIFLIMAIVGVCARATTVQASLDSAAVLYDRHLYNDALAAMLQVEQQGSSSSALCYNIGATYYRLNNMPLAVTYFERARLLDPGNDDAVQALAITRERGQIADDAFATDHYMIATFKRWMFSHAGDTYATWAVVAFIVMLAAVALFLLSDRVALRKLGFFGALTALVACVALNVMASTVNDVAHHHRFAVISQQGGKISAAPRAVNDSADVVLTLKPGTRVLLIDSVTTDSVRWYAIEHPRATARRGWLPSTAVHRP